MTHRLHKLEQTKSGDFIDAGPQAEMENGLRSAYLSRNAGKLNRLREECKAKGWTAKLHQSHTGPTFVIT